MTFASEYFFSFSPFVFLLKALQDIPLTINMSRIKTYPRECPGCKQEFNHRQNWSRHINGDKKQNPCYWYQEWKKNQSIKINTENIRLPTSNSHFIESKPIFSSTNNTALGSVTAPVPVTSNQLLSIATTSDPATQTDMSRKRKRDSESIDFSTITPEEVDKLKGKTLKEANEYFELKQKVGDDSSVVSQRARIKEVIGEPNARQKYGHYFVKRRRTES